VSRFPVCNAPPPEAMPAMDESTKAMCYKYRHPPKGQKPKTYEDIAELVLCKDRETHPTKVGVWKAVRDFNKKKKAVGRPKGRKKTSAKENKVIMSTFHKKRPPGHGVDARDVHDALPKKIRSKIGRRTVRRRLEEKGYTPQEKLQKDDPPIQSRTKRWNFGKKHQGKSQRQWRSALQAVGDLKDWKPEKIFTAFLFAPFFVLPPDFFRSRGLHLLPEGAAGQVQAVPQLVDVHDGCGAPEGRLREAEALVLGEGVEEDAQGEGPGLHELQRKDDGHRGAGALHGGGVREGCEGEGGALDAAGVPKEAHLPGLAS
jgi:hypothetical protein